MELYPENALILAPLSGFTDLPYRRAARRCACRFAFTEMVDAASIAYSPARAENLLLRGADEEFLGVQLVGADLRLLEIASRFLAGRDFDLVDLNLGCPVPKVVKKGAGAALGMDIERAPRALETIVRNVKLPVTAKFRILSDSDPAPSVELARRLVDAGAQALTVHGRTRDRFYAGQVHYEIIRAVAESVKVPVIANGGIHDPVSAQVAREQSGCSRLMLAQGAMGNPWLFSILSGGAPPTLGEWKSMVHTHVAEMVELYGEATAMKLARKICHDYLRGRGFAAGFRAQASGLTTFRQLENLLDSVELSGSASPGRELLQL